MNEIIEKEIKIENMIYEIRGKQVMLDSDVARLFGYETKYLNRQVLRNIERFPENYCFKLEKEEYEILKCQIGTSSYTENYGGRRYLPFVFTEYGITMLAGILKSDVAVKASLKIVNTFIEMRRYISNELLEQRYMKDMLIKHDRDISNNTYEIKLLQESFDKMQSKELVNEIYFNGQIYDAYSKILDIISKAKNELIIIDNYADKTLLDMISRIKVKVILITKTNGLLTKTDIDKYNKQYSNLTVKYDDTFHDRYFILDKSIVYHCGASVNYVGSKTFSINILQEKEIINSLIKKVGSI